MCELLGMSFAKPVAASISMRDFALRGEENADGWGLAWYPDQSASVIKEPIKWRASPHTGFLENYPRLSSPIYIAHVRHRTTGGDPTHADTHPFSRELNGHDYCFAHNGTLLGPFWELPLGRYHPIGKTDSEHMFCHILGQLADHENQLSDEAGWRWLHAKLTELNRQGRINCLLSDGQRLFSYFDAAGWKGLTFSKMYVRGNKISHLEDETVQIDLKEDESVNPGFVVATRPLSTKGWHNFEPGELLVLENGLARFSTHRST
jgi:glutamine amidotransferase